MATDERDILELLNSELKFIESGGYKRSLQTPWLATCVFRDSPTCINFGDPNRSHPCDECLLTALVPREHLSERVPCHFIPLNPEGETIHYLERNEPQDALQEKVKDWLRRMIRVLEAARAEEAKV
ncbi:MAG TPA: hypothetical protein VL523_18610 [Terriglobia bacterium]|nr:hypothetical protein [Terriglobia bacterium]